MYQVPHVRSTGNPNPSGNGPDNGIISAGNAERVQSGTGSDPALASLNQFADDAPQIIFRLDLQSPIPVR
jgi:hypothetical protein